MNDLQKELEKYKKAYERASAGLMSIVTCGDLITEGYAINVLKNCEAILKE